MPILGLGSNLGNKLSNLRIALNHIHHLPNTRVTRVSPVYYSDPQLPPNAKEGWRLPYVNAAIDIETALSPIALLRKLHQIEFKMGRNKKRERWAPRVIDIDILTWGDLVLNTEMLTIPHPYLFERPFALWPLADISPFWQWQNQSAAERVEKWGSRFQKDSPFFTHQIYHRIDTPELVGVINITPNSFSDGSKFIGAEYALSHAKKLVAGGAAILELGAESTAPLSMAIDENTEWLRLLPVLDGILSIKADFPVAPIISVDTRHVSVAEKALQYGADWINDVTGLDQPDMRRLIKSTNADCVIMHHLHIPENRKYVLPRNQHTVDQVYQWGLSRLETLEKEGIAKDKIIFDPGIGFGKMAEQSIALLQKVDIFKSLGTRIMVGHSRKSYLSVISSFPPDDRDIETTAISLYLSRKSVNYLRVHETEICSRALRASQTVWNEPNTTITSFGNAAFSAEDNASLIEEKALTD